MTVRVYRSDDASAPALLNNTPGCLIAVLDACLVNGYGAKTAAGWSKAFSGTNKAVYRTGAGTHQRYLRVDDSGATSARIVGYEAMTDVDTGTNPFPTAAQVSGGLYLYKSNGTTLRPWVVIATEAFAYIYVGYEQTVLETSTSRQGMYAFGDFPSFVPSDQYNTLIVGDVSASTSASNFGSVTTGGGTSTNGHYTCRNYAGTVGAAQFAKSVEHRGQSSSAMGTSGISYPSPINNGLELKPIAVNQVGGARGSMPGLWAPNHALPASHTDTFAGTGALAGKNFILLDCADGSTRARAAIETSNTW